MNSKKEKSNYIFFKVISIAFLTLILLLILFKKYFTPPMLTIENKTGKIIEEINIVYSLDGEQATINNMTANDKYIHYVGDRKEQSLLVKYKIGGIQYEEIVFGYIYRGMREKNILSIEQ